MEADDEDDVLQVQGNDEVSDDGIEIKQRAWILRPREFTLTISEGDTVVQRSYLRADGPLVSVNAMTVHAGDESPAMHMSELMPWHNVAEIAALVAGDGKDSQRVALADGILRGFQKPSAMLIYRSGSTPSSE